MSKMIKLGPRRMKGSKWDEGGMTEIVQILISHQQDYINSIQFLYHIDEEYVLSEVHGEPTGLKFNTVVFRCCEFLTSISGVYSCGRLFSIVFKTNKKRYGPFGTSGGAAINAPFDEFNYEFGPMQGNEQKCCFGGFHGSVLDGYVNAIGVYIKPLAPPVDPFEEDGLE